MVNPRVAYLGFPHPEAESAAYDSINVRQNDRGERDRAAVPSGAPERGRVGPPRRCLHEAAHKLGRAR
jgi:hypothetical protein